MSPSPIADVGGLVGHYLGAQLAGDHRRALSLVMDEALGRGMRVPEVLLAIVQPAQREIGRLWQENRISVAQEHLATSISQLVLSRLYECMPRDIANGRTALVACVEGEHHDVGARIGADFLEMQGFDVRFLGANVPVRDLVAMIARDRPDVVGLSATMSFHRVALEDTVLGVRNVAPTLPIVVGGNIFEWSPQLAKDLDVCAAGNSAEMVTAWREWFH